MALTSALVDPELISSAVGVLLMLGLIALRPEWGVGTLLAMLMMQYRNQYLWISQVLPSGTGLLSINNILGLVLALVMTYQLYRDGDWSFLRNRQVQLVCLIIGGIIVSSLFHPLDYGEVKALGLRPPNQDPVRLLVSRGLFVLLFVFFVRGPRAIRLLFGIFLVLSLLSAVSGSLAALGGEGWGGGVGARVEESYRAGGGAAITRVAGNPNRLAMISVLMIVLIWEYGQSERGRRWAWLGSIAILWLILTIFLTASRGGLVGLSVAGLLLFARRRAGVRRLVYGVTVGLMAVALVNQIVPQQSLERLSNLPGVSEDATEAGIGSLERREYTLGIALQLARENPLLGIGVGNWEKERFLRDPLRSITVPHNSYMLTFVESGVLVLALYLGLFWVTLRQLALLERQPDAMQQARDEGLDWLVTGTRLALVLLMVFSLFADLWETITLYFLFGIAAVLLRRYLPARPPLAPTVA